MSIFSDAAATSYIVRVKSGTTAPRTYLFGSASIQKPFDGRYTLFVRVPHDADGITVVAQGPGAPFNVCDLGPGEAFAVSLFNLAAVWAENPRNHTKIHCALMANCVP
jgi:hypothetical protein